MLLSKISQVLQNITNEDVARIESHLKVDDPILVQVGEDFQAKLDFNVVSDKIKTILVAVKEGKELDLTTLFRDTNLLKKVDNDDRKIVPIVGHMPSVDQSIRVSSWPFENQLPGAIFVVGGTGSGKTIFVSGLEPDIMVRMSEPVESVDYDPNVNTISVSNLDDMLTAVIVFGLLNLRVAVDSIRSILYAIKGPASSGGVVATVYNLLTSMNNILAHYNIVCPIVINPMVKLEDVADVYNRAAASAVGAVHMEGGAVLNMQYRSSKGRRFDVEMSRSSEKDEEWTPHTIAVDVSDMDLVGREPRRLVIGNDTPQGIDDADDMDPRITPLIKL
jgi:hypothetical protein